MLKLPLAVIAGTLALAGSAVAAPTYYFSCAGDSKVQNNQAQDWSTTKPAVSFTAGAGCGSADPGLFTTAAEGVEFDFYGGGKHTGPISTLNVELHSLLLSQLRVPATIGAEVELVVDGENVLGEVKEFRAPTQTSSTGLTQAFRFSIARELEFDEEGNELPRRPLVAGAGEHTVELRFSSAFLDYQNLWVWGASEVPAHVEIDPAALSDPQVFADG